MPRNADDVRTRLLRKLTEKREGERRKALNREKLRTSQIKETSDKLQELYDSIEEGTGVLLDSGSSFIFAVGQGTTEGHEETRRIITSSFLVRGCLFRLCVVCEPKKRNLTRLSVHRRICSRRCM